MTRPGGVVMSLITPKKLAPGQLLAPPHCLLIPLSGIPFQTISPHRSLIVC
jgi:hypothetical protein